ncbi:AbrB/MazE/SpoVT family DNA-binding domain-containing protein [Candidatus Woesearchaeota archaeon]|nr:AbrB/MazE/SpoVT family DNA-binding domain-containing protein [Candidatus Woesearchaeota archaeon]
MNKCPLCGKGKLKLVKEKHVMFGVDLGTYPAEKCTFCSEIFTGSSIIKKIEEMAKKKGIWGLGATTKITKTGNSLAVRIPKKIVKYLKLKNSEEVYIYPEKDKIIIESK